MEEERKAMKEERGGEQWGKTLMSISGLHTHAHLYTNKDLYSTHMDHTGPCTNEEKNMETDK